MNGIAFTLVSGFYCRCNIISLPTTRPSPGEDIPVNEELQDIPLPVILHDDQRQSIYARLVILIRIYGDSILRVA
jgi:hypothetical protein